MGSKLDTNKWGFETKQLHVGQELPDTATGSRVVPIYQTTSYVFENCQSGGRQICTQRAGNIYGRLTNSTQEVLEKRMASLEGGAAALARSFGARRRLRIHCRRWPKRATILSLRKPYTAERITYWSIPCRISG